MTTLLFVVLGVVTAALIVMAVRSIGGSSPHDSAPHASSPWFARAREIIDHADRLTAKPDRVPVGHLGELPTDQLRSFSVEFVELSGEVAALSATAPTTMDARVTRSLGTQVRLVGDVFDRELRRRDVFVDDPDLADVRPHADEVAARLRDLEVAVDDLRTHVELL